VEVDVAMDMAMKWAGHLKWHKAIRGHSIAFPVPSTDSDSPLYLRLAIAIAIAPVLILPRLVGRWHLRPSFFLTFSSPGKWFYTRVTSPSPHTYMNAMVISISISISIPQCSTACVAAYNNGKKCMFLLQIAIVKNFIHGRIVVLSSPHRVTFRGLRPVTGVLRKKEWPNSRNLGVHSENREKIGLPGKIIYIYNM